MVADRLAFGDAEAPPARALGGLEALEQVEEGDGRVGGFGVGGGEFGEDWGGVLDSVLGRVKVMRSVAYGRGVGFLMTYHSRRSSHSFLLPLSSVAPPRAVRRRWSVLLRRQPLCVAL
jgi:hypothetical protein